MGIGSLGMSELVVIFVIVLVFFGPRRFPEIARSMGSAMREFRRSLNQIQRELEEVDPRKDLPGKDFLDEFRKGKPGNWLDPNRPRAATPGARNAAEAADPQVTGEAAGSAMPATEPSPPPAAPGSADPISTSGQPAAPVADGGEQLPMFEAESADPSGASADTPVKPGQDAEPPAAPTDRSRSD